MHVQDAQKQKTKDYAAELQAQIAEKALRKQMEKQASLRQSQANLVLRQADPAGLPVSFHLIISAVWALWGTVTVMVLGCSKGSKVPNLISFLACIDRLEGCGSPAMIPDSGSRMQANNKASIP